MSGQVDPQQPTLIYSLDSAMDKFSKRVAAVIRKHHCLFGLFSVLNLNRKKSTVVKKNRKM